MSIDEASQHGLLLIRHGGEQTHLDALGRETDVYGGHGGMWRAAACRPRRWRDVERPDVLRSRGRR
jgi:hypothetical protein